MNQSERSSFAMMINLTSVCQPDIDVKIRTRQCGRPSGPTVEALTRVSLVVPPVLQLLRKAYRRVREANHQLTNLHDRLVWAVKTQGSDLVAPMEAKPRLRPHVLLVMEKWCDGKPENGTTNSEHNLAGSLETTGLATWSAFHYDAFRAEQPGADADMGLLRACREYSPDLIVLTWLNVRGKGYNPKLEVLRLLSRRVGIPIVGIWFDSVFPSILETSDRLSPLVAAHVVLDSQKAYLKSRSPERYLPLWTPQDPRIFFDPGLPRPRDVSFVGSVANYPERQEYLQGLEASGVEVHVAGGQRAGRLEVQDYAAYMQTSKITLNFSRHGGGLYQQCKGRVIEATLCGSLLMEQQNDEVARLFTPGEDYVAFDSLSELVDRIRYFLAHPQERERIARSGCARANQLYSAQVFWSRLFERAGIKPG